MLGFWVFVGQSPADRCGPRGSRQISRRVASSPFTAARHLSADAARQMCECTLAVSPHSSAAVVITWSPPPRVLSFPLQWLRLQMSDSELLAVCALAHPFTHSPVRSSSWDLSPSNDGARNAMRCDPRQVERVSGQPPGGSTAARGRRSAVRSARGVLATRLWFRAGRNRAVTLVEDRKCDFPLCETEDTKSLEEV